MRPFAEGAKPVGVMVSGVAFDEGVHREGEAADGEERGYAAVVLDAEGSDA